MAEAVFKILRRDETAAALDQGDVYLGNALDQRDGFIHLSHAGQVAGTLERHFADADSVLLLRIDPRTLPPGTLRWERSRGGDLFPHLYAPLPWSAVIERLEVRRGADGSFLIPDSLHADLV